MKTKKSFIYNKQFIPLIILTITAFASCKKAVEVSRPINLITSDAVFTDDKTATSALLGIYSQMMGSQLLFASGALTIFPGLSADEIQSTFPDPTYDPYLDNSISPSDNNLDNSLWIWGYIYIYQANACMEGLNNSTNVSKGTKQQLMGEAKFIRAWCYLYLTNLFGNIPLITTTNYRTNDTLSRTLSAEVYRQIISDLKDAQNDLNPNYLYGPANIITATERTRPNKWAATALLARVYLYIADWSDAEAEATKVISSGDYQLVSNLNNVFLAGSPEAIWQLQPVITYYGNNTLEGAIFLPYDSTSIPEFSLTSTLVQAFEPNDLRKKDWVGQNNINGETYYYPYKYKVIDNSPAAPVEYSMVLRLAEQYLIRAEARAQQGNTGGAQSDLNMIRNRADLPNTIANDQGSLLLAIEHEREVELFCEWGNRWFDLKRTGRADSVLGVEKAGWKPSAALYPIPFSEVQANPKLTQNPGY